MSEEATVIDASACFLAKRANREPEEIFSMRFLQWIGESETVVPSLIALGPSARAEFLPEGGHKLFAFYAAALRKAADNLEGSIGHAADFPTGPENEAAPAPPGSSAGIHRP